MIVTSSEQANHTRDLAMEVPVNTGREILRTNSKRAPRPQGKPVITLPLCALRYSSFHPWLLRVIGTQPEPQRHTSRSDSPPRFGQTRWPEPLRIPARLRAAARGKCLSAQWIDILMISDGRGANNTILRLSIATLRIPPPSWPRQASYRVPAINEGGAHTRRYGPRPNLLAPNQPGRSGFSVDFKQLCYWFAR